jgi:cobalt-zinc-cadmium resistance protein CzcA
MRRLTHLLLQYRPLVVILLFAWLAGGFFIFLQLDIEAYPDPAPPLVEVITQNPSWSAEEMERQVTVPVETTLFGVPRLATLRSITIFGLSDVKLYFDFSSDYFHDRQEVLNRLQQISLPSNLQPQLSPWSPTGEIYRYQVVGPGYSLNDLTAEQNWVIARAIKQVPGIIDVTTFGGTTKQYQAEIDPGRLLQFGVTLPEVVAAVGNSNANVGGNYLTMGSQSVNVRGIGLLRNLQDMGGVVIAEHNGAPIFLRDLADVHEGYQPRLGQVGVDGNNDTVEAIVLLNRGEQSLPALAGVRTRIQELNNSLLPPGMTIRPLYDRTELINLTTRTVRHLVLMGVFLVTVLLVVFLGEISISLIAATTIPCALLFAFALMVFTGRSANLISIGAIDFGILVDVAVVVLESVYRQMRGRSAETSMEDAIADGAADAARPVVFSVMVIIVAMIPLFTMQGVPGRIFAPMSVTYGCALIGALLFALFLAPVLCSFRGRIAGNGRAETHLVEWLKKRYARSLDWALAHYVIALGVAVMALVATLALLPLLGGEFMPKLEEGNLWVRATLPQDVSVEAATRLAGQFRGVMRGFPEVTHVTSQTGRPDDGTDVTTFSNIEFSVSLKPESQWPRGVDKVELVRRMSAQLGKYPGIDFNFSQNIEDNVEEAMQGVKGENSVKLFGPDIDVLAAKAAEIRNIMSQVRGIADLAVFQETGQPELLISIDRDASARYGLAAADVNSAVAAAIGGIAATQIIQGDRRFDFVVRYPPAFRQTPEAVRDILLPTADGGRISLGQVAEVSLKEGAFTIYRENGRRYIPVSFGVRGRDLSGTIQDAQRRMARDLHLPRGYSYEWSGEYDSLRKEERRLLFVVPLSLLIIAILLFTAFNSWRQMALCLAVLPFGLSGGVLSLIITRTPFSISAAVGFASVIGVYTLGSVVLVSGIRRARAQWGGGLHSLRTGALDEMRPVAMACAAAALGLLPAAVASGIGVQAQQPLARVVVGGMVTSPFAILFLIPIFEMLWNSPSKSGVRAVELPD